MCEWRGKVNGSRSVVSNHENKPVLPEQAGAFLSGIFSNKMFWGKERLHWGSQLLSAFCLRQQDQ